MTDICERLRDTWKHDAYFYTNRTSPATKGEVEKLVNPDGPQAAALIESLQAEIEELRIERDALLEKPISLAKMDSIDENATDRMIAYYWWEQAQEARAALQER